MFRPKPERILRKQYPDELLLENLRDVHFTEANIPEHELLQFRRLQSLIYSLRVAGYDVEAMQTEAFVGAVLFKYVNCKLAVTRCEYDLEVNEELISKIAARLPRDFVWLTTNANFEYGRLKALPIGITDYCGYSPYHAIIGDTEKFRALIDGQPRTEQNLVLMNFNDRMNSAVRSHVRSVFSGKEFVTDATYVPNEEGYARYVQGLRSHSFSLAPRGVGIDTHRIWESLYAGCIPIVQKVVALREFHDLPIFFVDRWEDACNEDVLKQVRDEYYQRKWNLGKLTLSYWFQYVCRILSGAERL